MSIVFQCESCGAGFTVAESLAGKSARCKKCGQRMTIPAVGAKPRAAVATAAANAPAAPRPGRATTWLDAVTSQVALKPVTEPHLRAVRKGLVDDDDGMGPGAPYDLAAPPPRMKTPEGLARPASAVTAAYRGQLLIVQRFFRWLNETANLISIPFIGLFLMGLILHNRWLCVVSATAVVLLCLTRLVTGLANLVVIPFRDSPVQGLLFLIPPLTVLYLYQNWNRVRKPVERIAGPAAWIGGIVLAFAFLPWLRGDEKRKASVSEDLRAGVSSLKGEIRGSLEKAGVQNVDLQGLENTARDALETIEGKAREVLPSKSARP